jgi:glycosyltransferase involved in cell wall biosynthesis
MEYMKLISIVTTCFNEEGNLWELYDRTVAVMDKFPQYRFEFILADNGSTDHTLDVLRTIAEKDKRCKLIVNSRNFGAERSIHNVFRSATGDCVILMVSDLQDPPEVLKEFILKWEEGYKIVTGIKHRSRENPLRYVIRTLGYKVIQKLSSVDAMPHFTGFGLYDRAVADVLGRQEWPVPYFRGLVAEIGFERAEIMFVQPKRKYGKSSYNLFKLYDIGMSGLTAFSKTPLRFATLVGLLMAFGSFASAMVYLVMKILNWHDMPVGVAPLVIGFFFMTAVQFIFIGMLGEYVLSINHAVNSRPLVVEKERVGFDIGE